MSGSGSGSEGSGSHRSSYSRDSYHSDDYSYKEAKNKNIQQNKGRARGSGSQAGTHRNFSRNSTGGTPRSNAANNATRRMLSAGRIKINELRNKVTELTVQLANVQTENKQLVRQQRQQERQLAKFDHQENEAPAIVQRITEEANSLREQLRRMKQRYESKCEKLHVTAEELDKSQRLLKKMKSLVEDKKLAERDELNRKLMKLEQDMEIKDITIRDLYKHIENLQKNHRHEIGIERARHRETQQTLEHLQEVDAKLQLQLKEKEKELGVRNIYALRQNRRPHHLDSSIHSTPTFSSESQQPAHRPRQENVRKLRPMNTDINAVVAAKREKRREARETEPRRSESSDESNKDRMSAELTQQLEDEREMLAKLQAQEAENQLRAEQHELQQRELERQKDELERARKRMEDEKTELDQRRAREHAEHYNSAEEEERRRQKELLLARMKAIDDGSIKNADVGAESSSRKLNGPTSSSRAQVADAASGAELGGYRPSFLTAVDTDTDAGAGSQRPALVTVDDTIHPDDDTTGAVFGEYRPSFLTGTTGSGKTKKPVQEKRRPNGNLLVFDDDLTQPAEADKRSSPDLSFLSSQPPPAGSQSDLGGAGDRHNRHLLPRRARQQPSSMNGSASISVVNDLGDDIEEVVL